MPLRLEIKKELTAKSDRVKSVDIYPAEVCMILFVTLQILSSIPSNNVIDTSNLFIVSCDNRCYYFAYPFTRSLQHPWVLAALYNGNVFIWDYSTNVRIQSHPHIPAFLNNSNPINDHSSILISFSFINP